MFRAFVGDIVDGSAKFDISLDYDDMVVASVADSYALFDLVATELFHCLAALLPPSKDLLRC